MTPEDQPERLVISDDDLASPAVTERVEALKAAAVPQTVRSVGAPPPATGAGKWWLGGTFSITLAGVIGGFAGFVLSEVIARPDTTSGPFQDDPGLSTAFFLVLFAVGLAGVMASWEGIQLRSADKVLRSLVVAIPLVGVAGFIGGYIVQTVIYEPMIDAAFNRAARASTDAQVEAILMNGVRIARSIGFGFIGGVLGVALGASTRSGKRAVNGLIGGAIGGLIGGFLFDFVGEALQSGTPSRAVALVLTGTLTGVAIGLVEQLRKDHWLEIVTGGMAGKQFILYHDRTDIGASSGCHVTLIKDQSIPELALSLVTSGPNLLLQAQPSAPVTVNGQVPPRQPLNDGDIIQVGTTVLRYGQKAQAVPQVATY